jgi:lipopolysaccharide/colanic/teichoic acid biosynthesis glycosyltransferase
MRLIVIREPRDDGDESGARLLRYALSTTPLTDVVAHGLRRFRCHQTDRRATKRGDGMDLDDTLWALPQSWQKDWAADLGRTVFYTDSLRVDPRGRTDSRGHPWVVISHGRFVTHVNCHLLGCVCAEARAEVLAVTAVANLLAYREEVRLTQGRELVGYRRLYADSMMPVPVPVDWPHHLLVRREAVETVFQDGVPASFDVVRQQCQTRGLRVRSVAIGGSVLDLESAGGLLALCRASLHRPDGPHIRGRWVNRQPSPAEDNGGGISPQARLVGPVLLGERVSIEAGAVVIGPSILCTGSIIRTGAIVDSSVIGADTSIEPERVVRNRIIAASLPTPTANLTAGNPVGGSQQEPACSRQENIFRTWPKFSYARCFKRAADIVAALAVLVLFAPVIPFIALAVKFSSAGPVFFRDKRQGLHGALFDCIKLRTMRQGADKMQEKLRFVSEVDGPQFKMADDPRITAVGRFLRETYLDEIPQFFNVLCGQMSVVGPRPSPEAENTLCPSWRDARLSVRPGITGLWQVRRTREPHKDFQEWIQYDTQYVRELSLRLDLWICWRTFRRMVENFTRQF